MKAFTVYVPEDKVPFFMELLNNLKLKVKETKSSDVEISEAHQKVVMERFGKVRNNPERLLDWDEARKAL